MSHSSFEVQWCQEVIFQIYFLQSNRYVNHKLKSRTYLLDSLQATKVVGFWSLFEDTGTGGGTNKGDEDNDVQTGFHFKISFE